MKMNRTKSVRQPIRKASRTLVQVAEIKLDSQTIEKDAL